MVVNAVYAGALSPRACDQTIHVFTNNRTALATLRPSARRSGQTTIDKILKHVRFLQGFSNHVIFAWAPVNPIFEPGQKAKQLAQLSTNEGREAQVRVRLTKTAVRDAQDRLRRANSQMSTMFGEAVLRIDAAWPGNHTRCMYDDPNKRQASVLAQLRSGMTPLNGSLHNIEATKTNLCDCGVAAESREHFIFHCARWSEQRKTLGVWTGKDNLSCLLGGKSITDIDDWKPDTDAVRAVIHFTLATKRFKHDTYQQWRRTRQAGNKSRKTLPYDSSISQPPSHPRAHGRPPLTMNTWKHSFKSTRRPPIKRTQNRAIHTIEWPKMLKDNVIGGLLGLALPGCM
jgi:hypothetical protein